jgi:hexosaminidase
MKSNNKLIIAPSPRKFHARAGVFALPHTLAILCQNEPQILFPIAIRLQEAVLETQGLKWEIRAGQDPDGRVGIALTRDKSIPAQGYRLSIKNDGISILAGEASGAFYAVMTLRQILRQSSGSIPCCEIEDHPDFPSRGIMVDVSRDKVPTLDTLFKLIDEMAEWKLNHLELYIEHAFAYRNHKDVWIQASPLTGEDILKIDAYCRERFIELVPNQNSFGHLHRWLELPDYRDLAECPDGFDHPWGPGGRFNHPFSLNPIDPRSTKFIEELYAEYLPYFTSRKLNIGGDETIDLGLGKSKEICEKKGKGRVYLDFLLKLYKLIKRHKSTMHFWGDIIIQHPELVPELPKDIAVLEWGYEANHPFDEHGAKFAQTGLPFYVCPGTSAWNSFAGRTENCLGNLRNAAKNGLKHGAIGFLNTDWGDMGYLQYLPVSYLGYLAGAALSWCFKANQNEEFMDALNMHVFKDSANVMGKLVYDLGNTYLHTGTLLGNSSVLFRMLSSPADPLPETVTEKTLKKTREYIDAVMSPISQARMNRPDASLIVSEYENTRRILHHACHRGTAIRQGTIETAKVKDALAKEIREFMGNHRELWMARNRVGGLQDSTRILEILLKQYTQK